MLTFLILLILAWSFYIGYARGIILQSYYFLVTLVALLIAGGSYKGLAKVLSLWVPFSSPTQQSVNYFYANRYLFQLDDIFYAGLAYVLIFAMIYLIGRVIGIFMHLVPQPEKLEDRKYQIGAGVIAVVITLLVIQMGLTVLSTVPMASIHLLVIQMGLTVLSTVPMASIQNRLNASGLIRFIILHTPISSSLFHNLWVTAIIGA